MPPLSLGYASTVILLLYKNENHFNQLDNSRFDFIQLIWNKLHSHTYCRKNQNSQIMWWE